MPNSVGEVSLRNEQGEWRLTFPLMAATDEECSSALIALAATAKGRAATKVVAKKSSEAANRVIDLLESIGPIDKAPPGAKGKQRCPFSLKVSFTKRDLAGWLNRYGNAGRARLYGYKCDRCRWWHLTKRNPEEKQDA